MLNRAADFFADVSGRRATFTWRWAMPPKGGKPWEQQRPTYAPLVLPLSDDELSKITASRLAAAAREALVAQDRMDRDEPLLVIKNLPPTGVGITGTGVTGTDPVVDVLGISRHDRLPRIVHWFQKQVPPGDLGPHACTNPMYVVQQYGDTYCVMGNEHWFAHDDSTIQAALPVGVPLNGTEAKVPVVMNPALCHWIGWLDVSAQYVRDISGQEPADPLHLAPWTGVPPPGAGSDYPFVVYATDRSVPLAPQASPPTTFVSWRRKAGSDAGLPGPVLTWAPAHRDRVPPHRTLSREGRTRDPRHHTAHGVARRGRRRRRSPGSRSSSAPRCCNGDVQVTPEHLFTAVSKSATATRHGTNTLDVFVPSSTLGTVETIRLDHAGWHGPWVALDAPLASVWDGAGVAAASRHFGVGRRLRPWAPVGTWSTHRASHVREGGRGLGTMA